MEFRRHNFRRDITHAVLYSTSPIRRLVGLCEVAGIVRDTPMELWRNHGPEGGIERETLLGYLEGLTAGTALILQRFQPFARSIDLSVLGVERAPQSFQYLNPDHLARLSEHTSVSMTGGGQCLR